MMITTYTNGNAEISILSDGTRIINYEDNLLLEYPLNIDIRVSTTCPFGLNPKTGKAFCSFCHESATTNGIECDYIELQNKLVGLPKGIELAVGCNVFTSGLYEFLIWCKSQGFIVNLTVNQGHLKKYRKRLNDAIKNDLIKGLGISYRESLIFDVPEEFLSYDNTVFHVIAGVDSFNDIETLHHKGVKKILILGYKTFGFGVDFLCNNEALVTTNLKEWYWWVHKLFFLYKAVSFDNLALQQLNIKRFFNDEEWEIFNQSEYSFYIDASNKKLAPSSRSDEKIDWNDYSLKEYFKLINIV